ncbi:MAG TPA: ThiF family adenylyltransferase [Candidatus Saccharimonadales bacterium]|nr:ThiF family adenylyltransferase [Candidatus Saccharimonadales bacterium]
MRDINSPEGYRNMGFWNDATQEGIYDTHVAIGGTGGAGWLVAEELAHIGVQNFTISDIETFENTNANRVLGATTRTYGRDKVHVMGERILEINPDANIRILDKGINERNIRQFVDGAHIILDATELSMPELGTMVCREARLKRDPAPVVNAEYVGHGAQVTSFDPNSKWTFEKVMGLKGGNHMSYSEAAKQKIATDRFLAYIPPYADLGTLKAMEEGAPLPSNMIGAGLAAQMAVAEMVKHVRQRIGEKGAEPVFAPRVRWMDAYTGESGTTKFPRLSFYRHLGMSVIRNQLGLHEPAGYSSEERTARGDAEEMPEQLVEE